jgi:multiple sugar transport system ATP-binding protein
VMKDGLLQQVGAPQELYDRPHNTFVAGFIGSPAMNFFQATVKGDGQEMHLDIGGFQVPVPAARLNDLLPYLGKEVIFGIRPENICDPECQPPSTDAAPVTAMVDVTEVMGSEVFLHLVADGKPFLARVDPRTSARPGREIRVEFDMARMHAFDAETEHAIGPSEKR